MNGLNTIMTCPQKRHQLLCWSRALNSHGRKLRRSWRPWLDCFRYWPGDSQVRCLASLHCSIFAIAPSIPCASPQMPRRAQHGTMPWRLLSLVRIHCRQLPRPYSLRHYSSASAAICSCSSASCCCKSGICSCRVLCGQLKVWHGPVLGWLFVAALWTLPIAAV